MQDDLRYRKPRYAKRSNHQKDKKILNVNTLLIILAKLIGIILEVVTLAMIVRMLLPLFFDAEDSKIYTFVFLITEPFIIPVRFLLFKLNLLQDSPIDWSFTISYLLIVITGRLLPVI